MWVRVYGRGGKLGQADCVAYKPLLMMTESFPNSDSIASSFGPRAGAGAVQPSVPKHTLNLLPPRLRVFSSVLSIYP